MPADRTVHNPRLRSLALAVLALLAGCASPPQPAPPSQAQPAGWQAVLIAGDDQEPAFDNAVDAMRDKLAGFGVPLRSITVLKASGQGAAAATAGNLREAFARLDPAPGDGCFVFVTSHGLERRGLVLKRARTVLSPRNLAGLLDAACRGRPSVVIASGCFSGMFAEAPPLPAPNRVVLTAARTDRPSFGCNAGRRLTVFDQCVLEGLDRGVAWQTVMDRTRSCVAANERTMGVSSPSQPQIAVGAEAAGLLAFSRPAATLDTRQRSSAAP